MAATQRSTSDSVVRQLDTEMRMRRWSCQVVAPIQHSPERWTRSMIRSARSSSPKLGQQIEKRNHAAIISAACPPGTVTARVGRAQLCSNRAGLHVVEPAHGWTDGLLQPSGWLVTDGADHDRVYAYSGE
jgi:hypothetical protein